jgi:glutathione synthase/RimK-type ligase-like ATP-grasp enzyme
MKLVGIRRSTTYSPGHHAENDRLIFDATTRVLQRRGCSIQVIEEDDVGRKPIHASAIFSMCQGTRANQVLAELARQGTLVINAPEAAQNCHRGRLHRTLGRERGVFVPMTLVSTHEEPEIPNDLLGESGVWVKRGDVHATQAGDVIRVHSVEMYRSVLEGFRSRGIDMAAVEPHQPGEVVKFYGVMGASFFRFYCEADFQICPVAFASARTDIEQVVRRLGLEIYGGDAVMTPDGRVVVIDINDWPSFAPYRTEAAEAIGHHIYTRIVRQTAEVQVRQEPGVFA